MTSEAAWPEYDREADLDEQERFILPPDLRPRPHAFVEQPGTDECGDCSLPRGFGALHPDEEPPAEPVAAHAFQAGDVVASELGGVFEVVASRYEGLRFLALGPVTRETQGEPRGATLLLRGGKAVCKCLGCTP